MEWSDAELQADEIQPVDIQLIKETQDGNAEAFGQLYERYATAVFRFLFAHLSDRLDAEDLTEEVFFRVWRNLPTFREQGVPFIAFLFRVSRNALIDHYRRNKYSSKNLSIEEKIIVDGKPETGDAAVANIERQEIRQAMAHLPEDYQTVLLLRFMSDLSPDETAQVMGKSPGAVRVLQHRALAAFRKILDQKA